MKKKNDFQSEHGFLRFSTQPVCHRLLRMLTERYTEGLRCGKRQNGQNKLHVVLSHRMVKEGNTVHHPSPFMRAEHRRELGFCFAFSRFVPGTVYRGPHAITACNTNHFPGNQTSVDRISEELCKIMKTTDPPTHPAMNFLQRNSLHYRPVLMVHIRMFSVIISCMYLVTLRAVLLMMIRLFFTTFCFVVFFCESERERYIKHLC